MAMQEALERMAQSMAVSAELQRETRDTVRAIEAKLTNGMASALEEHVTACVDKLKEEVEEASEATTKQIETVCACVGRIEAAITRMEGGLKTAMRIVLIILMALLGLRIPDSAWQAVASALGVGG